MKRRDCGFLTAVTLLLLFCLTACGTKSALPSETAAKEMISSEPVVTTGESAVQPSETMSPAPETTALPPETTALPPETEPQTIPQTTSALEFYDRAEIIGLLTQEKISEEEAGTWRYDLQSEMRIKEFKQEDDQYLAILEYRTPILISEQEYQNMRETGEICLNEDTYVYTDMVEEDKPFLSEMGAYGMIYTSDPISYYQVEKVGEQYFFHFEIGGLSSCVSVSSGPYTLPLEPDTWVAVGPSTSEEFPDGGVTLKEFVEHHLESRALNAVLDYSEESDSFWIYNDLR